jgi:hypothetical protein
MGPRWAAVGSTGTAWRQRLSRWEDYAMGLAVPFFIIENEGRADQRHHAPAASVTASRKPARSATGWASFAGAA